MTILNFKKSGRKAAVDKSSNGFTIVELLVVVVTIGILAAITVISYTGITQKANIASMQSDLNSASTQIKLFQVYSPSGDYPTANNCPSPGSTEICLKSSGSNTFTNGYSVNNSANPKTFTLDIINGTTKYRITNDTAPVLITASTTLADTDPANWMTIGTQVWARYNINVGAMITGVTAQTNNAVVEKYCYNDSVSNCTTYGALYQWNEAMQYVVNAGAQGICPTGSHIPSDNDWKILEVQLGMTQVTADATAWRGTDQGTKLKPSGTSGLNIPLAGLLTPDGSFHVLSSVTYLWSSSESSPNAWYRNLDLGYPTVYRGPEDKGNGFSVRCVGN